MTPLLLLDVDGVLTALSDDLPETAVWPRWQRGYAATDGMSWPIVFSLDVVEQLVTWHVQGLVELQWLTTWGHSANGELRGLLGMPELAVAGTYDDEDGAGRTVEAGVLSHAAAAPSAPDPLSGRWWKYDVVRRLVEQEPVSDRLVIWIDDELQKLSGQFWRWAARQPRVLPIGPDPRTGLTSCDLDRIQQALISADSA